MNTDKYIPTGLLAKYTIQCEFPETGETGNWLFEGDDHRKEGTSLSPFFKDLGEFFKWCYANEWEDSITGVKRYNGKSIVPESWIKQNNG